MYDDALVPTDGSKGADRGVEYALDFAASYGATVHVLHAVDERIHGTTTPSSDELFVEELEEAGEEAVAAVAEAARERGLDGGDGPRPRRATRGHPRVRTRARRRRDGSPRGGRPPYPHLGSTADRVVQLADVPVLPL